MLVLPVSIDAVVRSDPFRYTPRRSRISLSPAPLRLPETSIDLSPDAPCHHPLRIAGGRGTDGYVAEIMDGSLPEGLRLTQGVDVVIQGTPAGMGWSTVRIRVTDIGTIPFMSATKTVVIRVQD